MAGRINTTAVLNNRWNSGDNTQVLQGTIAVHPDMAQTYDYALTSDPVLLQERKQTQELLYDIFKESPFFEKYCGIKKVESEDESETTEVNFAKKIERSDIEKIFYYMKEKLDEIQKLNMTELLMQICEFFMFDYKYVIDNVLSVPLQSKLYQEVYKSGHKKIIDETEPLF